jgi:hypothetical protein
MILPTTKSPAERKSPRKMVIFSKPKVGKTSALALLPDTLIIDLEGGTAYLDSMKIDVKKTAQDEGKSEFQVLWEISAAIKAAGRPYKRVVIDTVTALEDCVHGYAAQLYKATSMGANYKGQILNLPNGGGYLYLRQAFFNTVNEMYTTADEIILVGHLKDTMIEKNGKEVSAKELDLTGKIKSILSADVDAIGLMYREDNKCILSFNTSDSVICGARPDHLKNKEIVLTELIDGKLVGHWDQIYID